MLLVNGLLKFVELDNYENGCVESLGSHYRHDNFKAENINELLDKLKDFTGHDNILLNSCDESGRIDIQGMENADGYPATEKELQQWRVGQIDLYSVTYSFNVLQCTPYNIPEMIK